MAVRGVLMSCTYPGNKESSVCCSGLLFADEWILTLGTILEPAVSRQDYKRLSDSLDTIRHDIHVIPSPPPPSLDAIQFKAIIEIDDLSGVPRDSKKFGHLVSAARGDSPSLVTHTWHCAHLVALWRCPLIGHALTTVLHDWTHTPIEDKTGKSFEQLLSTFLLFRIGDAGDAGAAASKGAAPYSLGHVLGVLNRLEEQQVVEARRGGDIVIEATPFGREFFLNSHSQGIVGNRLGRQGCLLLMDARSSVGCEGGPIFDACRRRNRHPSLLGLVLSAVSWWKGEWVGFTLGVALRPTLARLRSSGGIPPLAPRFTSTDQLGHMDRSVVMVRCGPDWGSGVLVDASAGLVLTCSHVVKRDSAVSVLWRDVVLSASLVYRTRDGVAYDVAVLRVATPPPPGMQQASVSTDAPVKGETVFVVGFPLFSKHDHQDSTLIATVSRGVVSHVAPPLMLQTTCCVQSGASGGPVMRENGDVLGIVSCNAHDVATGALFPHVNMAVPAMAFATPLRRYCQTLDTKTLCSLEDQDEHVQKMWQLNFTRCKL